MVRGIDKFGEFFAGYEDNYVIIGGTACDMVEEAAGQSPRATKDVDIILIIEALTPEFVKRFWEFIKAGGYETRQKGNGKNEYFRFMKPKEETFPFQIEIFARKPDILEIPSEARLTPIPVDEDLSSLSAILMNDDYYHFTLKHSESTDGIHHASVESLIVLKAKAFLDLSKRKAEGEAVDEKNIRKHKNDIFRLSTLLDEVKIFTLPEELAVDLKSFCEKVHSSLPDKAFLKSIGLNDILPEEIFDRLCHAFEIKFEKK